MRTEIRSIGCRQAPGEQIHFIEARMQKFKLGSHGPTASAQGLGCMGMSISYGEPNDAESIVTIHRALDLGVNLIVTSDAYGAGANEQLVGRALKGRREGAVIATKFGNL